MEEYRLLTKDLSTTKWGRCIYEWGRTGNIPMLNQLLRYEPDLLNFTDNNHMIKKDKIMYGMLARLRMNKPDVLYWMLNSGVQFGIQRQHDIFNTLMDCCLFAFIINLQKNYSDLRLDRRPVWPPNEKYPNTVSRYQQVANIRCILIVVIDTDSYLAYFPYDIINIIIQWFGEIHIGMHNMY